MKMNVQSFASISPWRQQHQLEEKQTPEKRRRKRRRRRCRSVKVVIISISIRISMRRRRAGRRHRYWNQHRRRWWQIEIIFECGRRRGMRWSHRRRRWWRRRRRRWRWGLSRWGWIEWEVSQWWHMGHRWRWLGHHHGRRRRRRRTYGGASWTFANTKKANRRNHLDHTAIFGRSCRSSGEVEDEKNEKGREMKGFGEMFHWWRSYVVERKKEALLWIRRSGSWSGEGDLGQRGDGYEFAFCTFTLNIFVCVCLLYKLVLGFH